MVLRRGQPELLGGRSQSRVTPFLELDDRQRKFSAAFGPLFRRYRLSPICPLSRFPFRSGLLLVHSLGWLFLGLSFSRRWASCCRRSHLNATRRWSGHRLCRRGRCGGSLAEPEPDLGEFMGAFGKIALLPRRIID